MYPVPVSGTTGGIAAKRATGEKAAPTRLRKLLLDPNGI
jgi:hypothetical protein